jgi:hypothetical protein
VNVSSPFGEQPVWATAVSGADAAASSSIAAMSRPVAHRIGRIKLRVSAQRVTG